MLRTVLVCVLVCVFAWEVRGKPVSKAFDSRAYREEVERAKGQIPGALALKEVRKPDEGSDEIIAAFWYVARLRVVQDPAEYDNLSEIMSEGVVEVTRLCERHPGVWELLTLRLQYCQITGVAEFSPFLEKVFPYVILTEHGFEADSIAEELQYTFHYSFLMMLGRAGANARDGYPFLGAAQDGRWFLLADPDNPVPDDLRMWASLLREYQRVAKKKRPGLARFVETKLPRIEEAFGIEAMPYSKAVSRLSEVVSARLTAIRRSEAESAEIRETEAYARGLEEGRKQKTADFTPDIAKTRAELEGRAARLTRNPLVHHDLCLFYVRHGICEEVYPPSQMADFDNVDGYNAMAYYELTVRRQLSGSRDGAAQAAITFADRALAVAPNSVRAHLLKAQALVYLDDIKRAAECIREAEEIDPRDQEVRNVKMIWADVMARSDRTIGHAK